MANDKYSVSNFITLFSEGMAKPNRFRVEFALPPGVNVGAGEAWVNSESTSSQIQGAGLTLNKNTAAGGAVAVMCHTCSMPQRSLSTYEHRQNGSTYKVPHSTFPYDPISLSFYADNDMNTRHFFEIWQNAVVNIGNNSVNFYNEFVSDVRIYHLDAEGNDRYYVDLIEAYPINIGAVDYSYGNNDTFQTVNVTMSFKYWDSKYEDTRRSRAA